MLATAIIIFREVLEMALVIGVVMAAAKGAVGRERWVGIGVAGGAAGAAVVALFADAIAEAVAGSGQELFNAIVLGSAAFLIGWTVVWMKQHGREMSIKLSQTGKAVAAGDAPMHMLAIVVGLAVLREGSEAVLFLYGVALSQPGESMAMLAGGLLGLAMGAGAGALLYFGLLRISPKHMFAITGLMLTLLAAGMASQAAGYLTAADLAPTLVDTLWDSSALLPQSSPIGNLLLILVGYQDRPSGLQALVYAAVLALIYVSMKMAGRPRTARAA